MEGATGDETQKGIRQCILRFFCAFDAETLPPPSTKPHVIQDIENPRYQEEISTKFLQKVEFVREKFFDNCSPKKGFTGGSVVTGFRKLCAYGLSVLIFRCQSLSRVLHWNSHRAFLLRCMSPSLPLSFSELADMVELYVTSVL